MSALEKARLQALKTDAPTETEGPVTAVQFNPSSLSIQVSNNTSGGQQPSGPKAEHTGGSSTLSLDLHFDTADEGTTASPVDVRARTLEVARFVLPRAEGAAPQPPPRVQFSWGSIVFQGVMTSMSEELDLFSASGIPLRAKVSVSIQNQDPRYESATGRGSARASGASVPGGGALAIGGGAGLGLSGGFGAAIGGGSIGLPQVGIGGGIGGGIGLGASAGLGALSVGVALDGESPAGFAARMGLDPAAWRALAAPGGIELSLKAGNEVAFSRSASTAPGVGTASGSGRPSPAASLQSVDGPAPALRAPGEIAAAGFALARAGGVGAAMQTARQQRADSAGAQELRAFGQGAAPVATGPARSPRGPLHALPGPGSAAAPAPPPPRADARATSFGLGVPLRPQRAVPRADAGVAVALGRRAPAAAPAPPLPPRHGGDCGCGCGGAP